MIVHNAACTEIRRFVYRNTSSVTRCICEMCTEIRRLVYRNTSSVTRSVMCTEIHNFMYRCTNIVLNLKIMRFYATFIWICGIMQHFKNCAVLCDFKQIVRYRIHRTKYSSLVQTYMVYKKHQNVTGATVTG